MDWFDCGQAPWKATLDEMIYQIFRTVHWSVLTLTKYEAPSDLFLCTCMHDFQSPIHSFYTELYFLNHWILLQSWCNTVQWAANLVYKDFSRSKFKKHNAGLKVNQHWSSCILVRSAPSTLWLGELLIFQFSFPLLLATSTQPMYFDTTSAPSAATRYSYGTRMLNYLVRPENRAILTNLFL